MHLRAGAVGSGSGGQVDGVPADPRRWGGVGGGDAAGGGADAGEQFVDVERFGDVVVGAGVEGVDLVVAVGPAGEHDDGYRGPGAQGPDDVDAVDVGQSEVEDDEVGPVVGGGA